MNAKLTPENAKPAGKPRPRTLLICINRRFRADEPSCAARGSEAIAEAIEAGVEARRIDIKVERIVCLGQCNRGPTVKLVPGRFYLGMTPEMVAEILNAVEVLCGTRSVADDGPPVHLLGS